MIGEVEQFCFQLNACAKHSAGYASAKCGRDYDGGEISELTL